MPNTMTFQISADAVSWYGAIVATLAFALGALDLGYKILGDKPKIHLKIYPHMLILPNGIPPHPKDTVFLTYNAINRGKIPVTIDTFGLKYKKGTSHKPYAVIIPGTNLGKLPYRIDPGQRHTVYAIQDQIVKDVEDIECFFVQDATGKEYRAKLTRRLRADILKIV